MDAPEQTFDEALAAFRQQQAAARPAPAITERLEADFAALFEQEEKPCR